jgi:hypothetical protein
MMLCEGTQLQVVLEVSVLVCRSMGTNLAFKATKHSQFFLFVEREIRAGIEILSGAWPPNSGQEGMGCVADAAKDPPVRSELLNKARKISPASDLVTDTNPAGDRVSHGFFYRGAGDIGADDAQLDLKQTVSRNRLRLTWCVTGDA